jgi:hypothetical protein
MNWFMGFQARARTPRDFGRRPGRSKSQTKPGKRGTGGGHRLEEEHITTPTEVVDKTFNSLSRLGNQRFAVAPFHEHYDRWLLSVRSVLSEFEANPTVTVDDRFKEESSRVLSGIELILKDRRVKETSNDEAVRRASRSVMDAKSLLAHAEREYAGKMSQIAGEKEHAVRPIVTNMGKVREELNRIVRMRAGFLRGVSKKAKAQKTTEATQKLDSTEKELTRIEQSFASEQQKLQNEYQRRRRQILEQIANYQREIENLEAGMQADDALDARHAACNALISAVNSLLQRTLSTQENLSKP